MFNAEGETDDVFDAVGKRVTWRLLVNTTQLKYAPRSPLKGKEEGG